MAVQYVPIDGELVSREWGVVLAAMRADGVAFRVNEGHRTWARQAFLRSLYLRGAGALAAVPSSTAPHIRTGRIDHALDLSNAAGAMRWLRAHRLDARLTVPGESWHVEVPAPQLAAFARRHPLDPVVRPYYVRPFRRNPPPAVRRLQRTLRALGFRSVPVSGRYGRRTRSALRRFQHRHGLKVDGIVGPATWRELRHATS